MCLPSPKVVQHEIVWNIHIIFLQRLGTTWQDFMMLRSVSETERRKTGRQIPREDEESLEISPEDGDWSIVRVSEILKSRVIS